MPTVWKNNKMVIIFKKGNKKDIKNYRPICLLSDIYKVLTKVLMKSLGNTLDELYTYVKHHIQGQKNKHLGKRKDQGHRHD